MADDMPDRVEVLQERLARARQHYAKLLQQRVEFERRALFNEALVMHTLAILNHDQGLHGAPSGDYPPPDHPLFVAALDAAHGCVMAARYRRLLLGVLEHCCSPYSCDIEEWLKVKEAIAEELRSHEAAVVHGPADRPAPVDVQDERREDAPPGGGPDPAADGRDEPQRPAGGPPLGPGPVVGGF